MNKLLVLLAAVMVACCGAPQGPGGGNGSGYADDAGPPDAPPADTPRSVLIRKECPSGTAWVGTGHIMDNETVFTANHVIMCSKAETTGPYDIEPTELKLNGSVITALEHKGSDELDLAMIHYFNHYEPLVITMAEVGERVCVYPATPVRGEKCGTVLVNELGHEGMMTTVEVVGGNSGSVMFNSKGEAVGVITSRDFIFSYGTSFETIGLGI